MQQHELVRTFFMTCLLSLNRSCSVKRSVPPKGGPYK